MKRQRGRNRRPKNNNNNNNNFNPNRSFDSNGPDVKVRGSAKTIFDKYTTLARDAASGGSRVKAENYLQHAEHYLRVMKSLQAKQKALTEQKQAQQEAAQKAREQAALSADKDTDKSGENAGIAPKDGNGEKTQTKRKSYKNGQDMSGATAQGEAEIANQADAKPTRRRSKPTSKSKEGAEQSDDQVATEPSTDAGADVASQNAAE